MYISEVKLGNWRNFGKETGAGLAPVSYVVGKNASGKSNLLDALRFLRDVANPIGGGLQYAIDTRGGMKKIRCLHAKASTDVTIEVTLAKNETTPMWRYRLSFNNEKTGKHTPIITQEVVSKYEGEKWNEIIIRPLKEEKGDADALSETFIERKRDNESFREIADFFTGITYFHPVPQLLKFSNQIGAKRLPKDPFGQGFLDNIEQTPDKIRDARLKNIEHALKGIMPYISDLCFIKDENHRPHLEIRYEHHRPHGAKQREDQFSDGTLRLIGLLWVLQTVTKYPLLLEEPELSLNEEIVKEIPLMIDRIIRTRPAKQRSQVITTTHSYSLLNNEWIGHDQITVIKLSKNGSILRKADKSERAAMEVGFPPSDVMIPALKQEPLNVDF